MKRFIYIILLLTTGFASCKKILDTEPTGQLVPVNSYSNDAQITAAMSGIYTNLKLIVGYSQYYTSYYTVPSDDTYFYNTTSFATLDNSPTDGTAGNPGDNLWRGCFQAANYCNTLLDNIDVSSASGTLSADAIRRAKGEARFMRGFYYFLLAQWYGDVPLQLTATAGPSDGQVARTPVKQVYDQIIIDMTAADSMLYDRTFANTGYTERITREAVQGMLARVCLYAAGAPVNDTRRYADALSWAKKVVNGGQSSLLSTYPKVFIDEAKNIYNRENMFEVGFIQNNSAGVNSGGGIGIYQGVPQGTVGDSGYVFGYVQAYPRLYFKYEPGDYRRNWNVSNYSYGTASSANIIVNGNGSTSPSFSPNAVGTKIPILNDRFWARKPAKWRREYEDAFSRSTQRSNSTNFPILRYSDVLLMLAEAEFKVNGATPTAFDAINQVRRRSISPTKIVDSISFVDAGIVTGTGYNYAPDSIRYTSGDGSGFSFNVVYNAPSKTVQVLLEGQGRGFTVEPTITIGAQWRAGAAYANNQQVAAPNGRLYTVTAAGTATSTAPTNTTGASIAASTGAVFTYAGYACKATVHLSPAPVVDYDATLLTSKGITFMEALMDERSRELCYETLRLPDLKRWGILVQSIKGLQMDIDGTNPKYPLMPPASFELGTSTAPQNQVDNVSAKDMFFPIPQRDLYLNLLLTQNPGY